MDHSFPIVDMHQHVGPYFNFHIARNDAAGLLAEMDRLGIRQGWVSAHAAIEGDAPRGNDETQEMVRSHPGRFLGYVGVDPNYPEELREELDRRMARPEFHMIKVHPCLAGYPLDGPNYEPVWESALKYRCPVLSHVWPDEYCGPDRVRRLLERHPDVRLIFAHALNPQAFDSAAQLARQFNALMLDITISTHAYGLLECAVDRVGADRLLFGTDMPFINPAIAVGKVLYARIADADKEKIFYKNAERLIAETRKDGQAPETTDKARSIAR